MTDNDDEARQRRAERLKKKIRELTSDADAEAGAAQRPGESDAEYVHRRMRELDREPKKPS